MLRGPQEDMSISIDVRKCAPPVPQAMSEILNSVVNKPTIRSLNFASLADVHKMQTVLTRYVVRYDSLAALFAISRRRMVVNLHKKLEASKVRLQILTNGGITQIAAFFEDFHYADAMVLQVKASDTLEKMKADKGGKHCVKFVDAKFSLPKKEKDQDAPEDEVPEGMPVWPKRVRRRFLNLECLEYAEERDDIIIGFDTDEGKCIPVLTLLRFTPLT